MENLTPHLFTLLNAEYVSYTGTGFVVKIAGQSERDVTAGEIASAQTLLDAQVADDASYIQDKLALKTQYQTAITRLEQIRDAVAPTNAQVVAAVKDLANYQLQILRFIRKL